LGIFGFSAYINERMKHKAAKKNKKEDKAEQEQEEKEKKLEEMQHEAYKKELREIVNELVQPLNVKLDNLNTVVVKISNGTLDALRDRILSTYYKCVEKGYRAQYDFENIHHMYDDYIALHGNSFVDDVIRKFDNLLSEEEYKAKRKSTPRRPRAKKKLLVESK